MRRSTWPWASAGPDSGSPARSTRRTGWFPRIRRVGLMREEDGRGGYCLVSTEPVDLRAQLDGIDECARSRRRRRHGVLGPHDADPARGAARAAALAHARLLPSRRVGVDRDRRAAVSDHRGRRGARTPLGRRQLHQCQRPRAPGGHPPAGSAAARLLRSPGLDPRLVSRPRRRGDRPSAGASTPCWRPGPSTPDRQKPVGETAARATRRVQLRGGARRQRVRRGATLLVRLSRAVAGARDEADGPLSSL